MNDQEKRPAYSYIVAALAAVTGLALVSRYLLRRGTAPKSPAAPAVPAPLQPAEDVTEPPPAAEPLQKDVALPTPTRAPSPPSILSLLAAGVGLGCLVAAQMVLLGSRHPLIPLLLYLAGLGLLLPAFAVSGRLRMQEATRAPVSDEVTVTRAGRRGSRTLFGAGALFFAVFSGVLAQLGVWTPLLVLTWLLSIFALGRAALPNERLFPRWRALDIRLLVTKYGQDVLIVGGFMLVAAYLQWQTPAPTPPLPEHRAHLSAAQETLRHPLPLTYADQDDSGPLLHYIEAVAVGLAGPTLGTLQGVSAFFAVLTVPAVYLLGRALAGRWEAFFAAGPVAGAGWTLALGKAGQVYSALAMLSAVYLAALVRVRSGRAYYWLGLLLAVGWMVSPLFGFLALLVPIRLALEEHSRRRRLLGHTLLTWLVMGAGIVPFIAAPLPFRGAPLTYPTGLDSLTTIADALASGLLLLNLTSDPSPLHGIVNRPVFPPIMAATFVVGLLGSARRASRTDALTMAALVISLLPVALFPLSLSGYPNLYRAALALPVAVYFAASGMAFLAWLLTKRWPSAGRVLALGLFAIALVVMAADARRHYIQVAAPAYEWAAPVYEQLQAR